MKRFLWGFAAFFGVALCLTASFEMRDPFGGGWMPQKLGSYQKSGIKPASPFGDFLLPKPAHAARWVTEDIKFRKYYATSSVDSACVYSKTGQGADTTEAISMDRFAVPYELGPAAAADSASWFGIYLGQCANTAPAIDTIYVGAQVSLDGVNWTGLASYTNLYYAATTIPPVASLSLVEMNSTNQVGKVFELFSTDGDLGSLLNNSTAPGDHFLFGYRYIRFVVTWGTEAAQPMKAWIGYWKE